MRGWKVTLAGLMAALLFATPVEFLSEWWRNQPTHAMGPMLLLNLGPYAQVVASFVVVCSLRIERRARLIGLGALVGFAVSPAWWFFVRWWYGSAELWSEALHRAAMLPGPYPATLAAGLYHYRLFSPAMGLLAGAIAGEVRWRALQGAPTIFQIPLGRAPFGRGFVWSSALTYLVAFRLAQEIIGALYGAVGAFDIFLMQSLGWCAVLVSSFAVSLWLWDKKPATRRAAISQARRASFVLIIGAGLLAAMLLLIYSAWIILATALITLNAVGFLWARVIGDLRWRYLDEPPAAT